jgi:hypothetical protein
MIFMVRGQTHISPTYAYEVILPPPSWSKVTYVGRTCLGKPASSSPSARGRFSRSSPDVGLSIGEPRLNSEWELHLGEIREAKSLPFTLSSR